jgi:hypothetical protein
VVQLEVAVIRSELNLAILVLLNAVLLACGRVEDPQRGDVLTDPSNPTRAEARWTTSRAVASLDRSDPLTNLLHANDLAVGPGDTIYVADKGAYRIVVYDPNGNPVRTLGRIGEGPGEFRRLAGIAVDTMGQIWALEDGRLQVLDPSGRCLASLTGVRARGMSVPVGVTGDDLFWVGCGVGDLEAYRLSRTHGGAEILKVTLSLRVETRGLSVPPTAQDFLYWMSSASRYGYLVLLPAVTSRKEWAWIQQYDRNGRLVQDRNIIDPGTKQAKGRTPALDQHMTLLPLGPLLSCADGTPYVVSTSTPLVIWRFDVERGALVNPCGVWSGGPGSHATRLEAARDVEMDSEGRLDILATGSDGQSVLLQTNAIERR